MKITVIGAGTWGMALARMLCKSGHDITVWSAIPSELEELNRTKRQKNLPNMIIPDEIIFNGELETVCRDRDILLFAVPSVYVRQTAKNASPFVADGQIIVDVAKGIEADTLMTMSEVINEEIPQATVVALSGPTHAEEVANDLPTTIVSACKDISIAETVQKVFTNPVMRVYTNIDVKGVELCGALKNIIALASGIASGLGYGDNTKAALITRGLAEMERLGLKMGCLSDTFSGLAGMGDLIVTATSRHSRNNKCGYLIGQGFETKEAVRQVGMVVEGINAIPAAIRLGAEYEVELPIIEAVNQVVNHGKKPSDAVRALMGRDSKTELPTPMPDAGYEFALQRNARLSAGGKTVITYGTFDCLNYSHINFLRRAKAYGDVLVVGLSTDEFNWNEKHKTCKFTYEQRKAFLEGIKYVDTVIPEETWEQKQRDVQDYHADTFVIGDDWKGKFDNLKELGIEVIYLPKTPEV